MMLHILNNKFILKSLILSIIITTTGVYSYSQDNYKAYALGFYNLENLFDITNQDEVNDEDFTPEGVRAWTQERYDLKIKNMASVIKKLGTSMNPGGFAGLGVSEIENIHVLQDLVAEPQLKARNLQIVHYDSPDKRGIDVGFLYDPAQFQLISSKPHTLYIEQNGKRKYTRDVLHVAGIVDLDTLHILVNHWPSRSGGEKRSAPGRKAAAQLNLDIAGSIYADQPNAKIVIMGDLNDDPSSPSLKKVLNAQCRQKKVKPQGFFNPMYKKHRRGEGSNAYRDSWSLFDQIIVNHALLDTKQSGLFYHKAEIYKEPRMIQKTGRYKNYPMRTFSGDTFNNGFSDHFPVVMYILKKV